jgi:predicted lipoprotein with Yx(FWY)xxD motif
MRVAFRNLSDLRHMFATMKNTSVATLWLTGVVLVVGCSGGGGGGGGMSMTPMRSPTSAPTQAPAPTVAPSTQATQSVLQTQNLDGGPAFVTSADFPVYESSADGMDMSNCTGGCLSVWPLVPPPAGALPSPWSSFTRSDNGQKQLAYNGHPLYTFSSDSPGVANGNGVNGFSLARPVASAPADPTPTATPMATPTAAPVATPTAMPTTNPY